MITLGVIGIGRIGQIHIENLMQNPEVHIKTIADSNTKKMTKWLKGKDFPQTTNNAMDIINDPTIDVVIICSPTATHYALMMAAVKAKKHIFCEKPVSFSTRATTEVLKTAKKFNVQIQIGFNRRYDTNFQRIQQQVAEGFLGKIYTLRITSREAKLPSMKYLKNSGGLFRDLMVDDFDMARYIMQSEVVEVYAKGATLMNSEVSKANDIDTAVVLLSFANGKFVTIENSRQTAYGNDQRLEVFGENGVLFVENEQPSRIVSLTEAGERADKPHHSFLERYTKSYKAEIDDFIQAIHENSPVACTINDGLQAERIAEAAQKSKISGRPVQVSTI